MKQINAASRDVLAKFTGSDTETLLCQKFKQFGMNKVNLTKIGAVRMSCLIVKMLYGPACVGVLFHAYSFNQPNLALRALAEPVLRAAIHRNHNGLIHACLEDDLLVLF